MKNHAEPEHFITHYHRMVYLIGYLLIFAFGLRRINALEGAFSINLALILLGFFTTLYALDGHISRRPRSSMRLYFVVQMTLVQLLGLFEVYLDTWALLYLALGFQAGLRCSRREAVAWWSLFSVSILVTLALEFGPLSGLGRAMIYIVVGAFMISYDIQYARHEDALAESQLLLEELREAHQKLEIHASQAEKLAAAQEHNRLARELYDSVGQKVFAIQLAAEATRLSLSKDPSKTIERLDDLQVQTQTALGQMRQLIGQWRPG